MRRRTFIAALGGVAAWPVLARAQQPEDARRVGVLIPGNPDDPISRANIAALLQGLEKLGWTDGRKIRLNYRWAGGDPGRVPMLAKELVALKPELIIAVTTTACIALKQETTTIPVVFVNVVDPIGSGLVASLARPGGNFTGFIHFEPSMASKWLELLKQVAPWVVRVAILYSPRTLSSSGVYVRAVDAAARLLQSLRLQPQQTTQPKSRRQSTHSPVLRTVA